jgi:mono/diheme cytochrome c family protein
LLNTNRLAQIASQIATAGVVICAALYLYQAMKEMRHQQMLALAPRISFDSVVQDLGKVDEGVEVHCQFKVANRGSSPLEIEDVKSSCGCTFPVWKQKRLMPGESAILPVTVDTAMKQDKVEKTMDVISNDPLSGFVTLTVKLDINDPHSQLAMGKDGKGAAKIFKSEKCISCHVDGGVGQFGKELFEADCAMCHRPGAHGKASVGPVLESLDYSDPTFVKTVKNVICYGSKTHRSMPGFLGDAGGPLAPEQIDSLVSYLKECKKK